MEVGWSDSSRRPPFTCLRGVVFLRYTIQGRVSGRRGNRGSHGNGDRKAHQHNELVGKQGVQNLNPKIETT